MRDSAHYEIRLARPEEIRRIHEIENDARVFMRRDLTRAAADDHATLG